VAKVAWSNRFVVTAKPEIAGSWWRTLGPAMHFTGKPHPLYNHKSFLTLLEMELCHHLCVVASIDAYFVKSACL
jgi:hypothetical protein